MAYDIGPKIGIEGEAQFRSALKNISQNIRTLGSEMDVVTSSFLTQEKGIDDLVRQQSILERQIDATREKIKLQAEMAGRAAGQYGATATETQKWEQALNKSLAELNKLKGQLSDVEKEMDSFGKETDDVEKSLDNAGKAGISFGDVLKANVLSEAIVSGIRALGNAVGEMASAFVDFAKEGLATASDLEEVQNVVDTTFGADGAKAIDEFAKSAAASFGLSELSAKQFTGTMGAMLKSMNVDEGAVEEMSTALAGLAGDMASFYNLDPEEAFAKLRSGISGETEPLKQLGINMSVANLEAYALAQGIETAYKDMTQAEQATLRYNYIMQATSAAQGDFVKTSDSYANQQRIMQLNMENLGASIGSTLLPYMTELTGALNGLLSGEMDTSALVETISGMALQAAEGIVEGLPAITEAASEIVTALIGGIQALIPEFVPVAMDVIFTLIDGMLEMLPELVDAAAQLLTALVQGISDGLPNLIDTIVTVVLQIADTLTHPDTLVPILDAGLNLILALTEGLIKAVPDLIDAIPVIIENLVAFIMDAAPMLLVAAAELIVQLGIGLIAAIPTLVANIPKVLEAIVNGLVSGTAKIMEIGKNIVLGLWEGIQSMWSWLKEKVGNIFGGLVDGIKDLFGIHSPSTVFAGIGGYMAEGLGLGFEKEMGKVAGRMQRAIPTPTMELGSVLTNAAQSMQAAFARAQAAGTSPVHFDLAIDLDGQTLARRTYSYNQREKDLRGGSLVEVYT